MAPARLKKRSDFVAASKGRRYNCDAFGMQMILRAGDAGAPGRLGFTVTKKTGGSVERNRIRRRLREAFRIAPALALRPAHDYVVVGREAALAMNFAALRAELARALTKIEHARTPRRHHGSGRDQARV